MTFTALIAVLTLLQAAPADPPAQIDKLYAELAETETPAQAANVASRIELVWADSGSDTVNLLLKRAEQAMAEQDRERAAQHLDTALKLVPDFAEGWNRRAMLYLAESEPGRALEAINRALTVDPRHFQALYGLGMILERMNNNEAAYEAFSEALKVNPHFEEAQTQRDRLAPLIEGRSL